MTGLTIDDLLAREEIGDVIKDLARGTDRLDAELMASCYHPDGTDDHNVFRGTGTEFAQCVVDTLPHFAATMHFIGSPRVRRDGGETDLQGDLRSVLAKAVEIPTHAHAPDAGILQERRAIRGMNPAKPFGDRPP